ncbi:POL5 protein, partial [Acromyrmex heyeri]
MSEIMEQRSAIKFCVRNGISAAETLRMCQKAYGDGALSQARVFAWHRMFKEGRESVQDEPRAGRPSTSTDVIHVQKIQDLVLANRRLTVRDLTDLVGISEGSVKPSESPYNTPVWIVPKRTDSNGNKRWRMVLDFRSLNELSGADSIDEALSIKKEITALLQDGKFELRK